MAVASFTTNDKHMACRDRGLLHPVRDVFMATAARTRAFNAFSLIFSPSWGSMARLVLPSRLALKRPEGSFRAAPFAKVIFTTFLYVSPVQINPSCDHTGTPLHFHSSTTSGSASLTKVRSWLSALPRQSPSSLILASISSEGDLPFCDSLPFMPVSPPSTRSAPAWQRTAAIRTWRPDRPAAG